MTSLKYNKGMNSKALRFVAAVCLYALVLTGLVFGQAAPKLDKTKLEAYLRHLELWVPQVNVAIEDPKPAANLPGFSLLTVRLSYNGASKNETYYVSQDGQRVLKGDVYDLAKSPFQSNIDKIKTASQASYGSDKADVTLVVYGDFQCPYCKQEAAVLKNNVMSSFSDKVHVYFKDFPLESIHPWAKPASIAGRCALRQSQDLFWNYHDWIYAHQQDVTADNFSSKLQEWAKDSGVDAVQLGRCVDTKATEAEVDANQAEGRALGVDATPTLFMNGRKLVDQLASWEALQQLIPMEIEHQAKQAEACCEVKIPMIGK